PPIYARHGVDARFVGHPMADAMPLNPDRRGARAALGVDQEAPVLAVLPGSRLGEIERLAPAFLQAAALVRERLPGLQVLVPAANAACREALEALLPGTGGGMATGTASATDAPAPADRLLEGSERA